MLSPDKQLIAVLVVSYIVVELAGALAVPTSAIVGASLATAGLLVTLLLKSRTDHRLVPANGIADLMDNRLLAASVAVGAGLSVAAIVFPS
jgi:membrane associated rhomboid family serine protease